MAVDSTFHPGLVVDCRRAGLAFSPAAAFAEELLARGYVFASLRDWLGQPIALALTSIGFGLLHLKILARTARSVSLVILAGVFLGTILIVTKSLYAAWMAHWAWNWVMAVPLHVAVSGQPMARPDYQIVDAGPDWLTGGPWGPEGGAGAALGMIAGLAYLYARRPRQPQTRNPTLLWLSRALRTHSPQRIAHSFIDDQPELDGYHRRSRCRPDGPTASRTSSRRPAIRSR